MISDTWLFKKFCNSCTCSPDDSLNQISSGLSVELWDMWQSHVINVITTATIIVSNVVTLLTITNWMISIITCTFRWKANADRRFVRRSTILKRSKISFPISFILIYVSIYIYEFYRKKIYSHIFIYIPCFHKPLTPVASGVRCRKTFDLDVHDESRWHIRYKDKVVVVIR